MPEVNPYCLTMVPVAEFVLSRSYSFGKANNATWELLRDLKGKRITYTVDNLCYVFTVKEVHLNHYNQIVAIPEEGSVNMINMLLDDWMKFLNL